MAFNVAVDGPAGAGKSTIARAVAEKMNLIYVDTGAMYRAMALFMLREQVDLEDAEAVAARCPLADITIRYEEGVQVVFLNGENVNPFLRTEEVGSAASVVSPIPRVRQQLGCQSLLQFHKLLPHPQGEAAACGTAAETGSRKRLHYGRQGYRHLRAARRTAENLSHRLQRRPGPAQV